MPLKRFYIDPELLDAQTERLSQFSAKADDELYETALVPILTTLETLRDYLREGHSVVVARIIDVENEVK